MPALHNTPERAAPGASAGARVVRLLPDALPPASGAAALLAAWRLAWPREAPWLLLAPERCAAAWTDALRAALAAGQAEPFPPAALRRLVRAGCGAGAALICGGAAADGGEGEGGPPRVRPALFALAPPTPTLLRAWSAPAPLLGIAAREPHEPLDRSGWILEDFAS